MRTTVGDAGIVVVASIGGDDVTLGGDVTRSAVFCLYGRLVVVVVVVALRPFRLYGTYCPLNLLPPGPFLRLI